LGESTTEFWRVTGDPASPLEPAGGLKFDIGCRARASAVNCDGSLIWVDHQCSVRLSVGGVPRIISDVGLSEQIRRTNPADLSASYFNIDQHACYVMKLGTAATWVYDMSSEQWTRMTSKGAEYWRAGLFCNFADTVVAADLATNEFLLLDPDRREDDGDEFTVSFQARIELDAGTMSLRNLTLACLLGMAPATGQGSDPLIGMRISRDGGYDFGPWTYRSIGVTGAREIAPRWNALGTIRGPFGGLIEFKVSDPVGRRFSGVRYNT